MPAILKGLSVMGVLVVLLIIAGGGILFRTYVVLNQNFPPVIVYDGGERAGVYTLTSTHFFVNHRTDCNRSFHLSIDSIENLMSPKVTLRLDAWDKEEYKTFSTGQEIVFNDPCTGKPEAIGKVIAARPTIRTGVLEIFRPARAQIEIYPNGWLARYSRQKPWVIISKGE